MAWDKGKRNRREESESDEGLGNVTVKGVVVVEKRRIVMRGKEQKEMALAM